jgi:hypothetical protein
MSLGDPSRLYRGVKLSMHVESEGRIAPKRQGAFEHELTADSTLITADNALVTIGPSAVNAVHWHQFAQHHHPTSGISTSPHFECAAYYATSGRVPGEQGVVYEIDRTGLDRCNVREFIVAKYVARPRVPSDDEVILVTVSGESLPPELVVGITKVAA